jgi:hypothetical protein
MAYVKKLLVIFVLAVLSVHSAACGRSEPPVEENGYVAEEPPAPVEYTPQDAVEDVSFGFVRPVFGGTAPEPIPMPDVPVTHAHLSATPYLNNPFQFHGSDRRIETPECWEDRREEIRYLVQRYYFGYLWPTTAQNVVVNTAARPQHGGQINITVNETRLDGTPVTATGDVATAIFLPTFEQLEANGFWDTRTNTGTGGPLVLAFFHGFSPQQIYDFNSRGIGLAMVYGTPGWNETRTGMYFELFPYNSAVFEYNTGTLMASAWTFSRVVDAFELNPQWGVNARAIASMGNSFAGKRALFAGAFDDRVALTIAHESGGDGGIAPMRFSHAGRILHHPNDGINRVHARHETARTGNAGRGAGGHADFFRQNWPYEVSTYLLPFDMHLVVALTLGEGRAFLSLETLNFGTWTGWTAARTVVEAAREVALFLGHDNIVMRNRHSGHMFTDTDMPHIWGILGELFGQESEIESIGGLMDSPIDVESAWMPWARPSAHVLWTENQHIVAGHAQRIVAFTCAPFVDMLVNGEALARGAAVGSTVVFELAADDVPVGVVELVTDGEFEPRIVSIQSVDAHTLLRNGSSRDNVGAGTQLGFTGRLANREDVQLYHHVDGVETRHRATLHQSGGNWITPYGVRSGAVGGFGFERAHVLRNIVFEAMPDFIFEFSFQEVLHTAEQPRASWEVFNNRGTTWDFDTQIDTQIAPSAANPQFVILEFGTPVNPFDFAIGINANSEFRLYWYNSQTVAIFFEDENALTGRNELIIYIPRLRAEGAYDHNDLINTPIRIIKQWM